MIDFNPDLGAVVEDDTPTKRFKMCWVDADTILFRAAKSVQVDYIDVKHTPTGRIKRFDTRTKFGIRAGKATGMGWLGKLNKKREEKSLEVFDVSEFEIEDGCEVNTEYTNVQEAIESAVENIDFAVGSIKKHCDSEEYTLVISAGDGNYRDDHAKLQKYKGKRAGKPILYSEVKEAMLSKYGRKIFLSSMCEAEDVLGWRAMEEFKLKGADFSKWDLCLSFLDKDVKNVYAPSFNYTKLDEGWRFPTHKDCTFELTSQVIAGDPTDDIPGLPNLPEEVTAKFGLRKANGCGKTTGENLVKGCDTEKGMWERAVFAYQSYYGMEPINFKSWDGDDLTWTWLDYMQETAILVKMQEYEGHVYNVKEVLDGFNIEYSKKLFGVVEAELVEEVDIRKVIKDLKGSLTNLHGKGSPLSYKKSESKASLTERLDKVNGLVEDIESKLSNFFKEV